MAIIPVEIWYMVASFLEVSDLSRLGRTSKGFYELTREPLHRTFVVILDPPNLDIFNRKYRSFLVHSEEVRNIKLYVTEDSHWTSYSIHVLLESFHRVQSFELCDTREPRDVFRLFVLELTSKPTLRDVSLHVNWEAFNDFSPYLPDLIKARRNKGNARTLKIVMGNTEDDSFFGVLQMFNTFATGRILQGVKKFTVQVDTRLAGTRRVIWDWGPDVVGFPFPLLEDIVMESEDSFPHPGLSLFPVANMPKLTTISFVWPKGMLAFKMVYSCLESIKTLKVVHIQDNTFGETKSIGRFKTGHQTRLLHSKGLAKRVLGLQTIFWHSDLELQPVNWYIIERKLIGGDLGFELHFGC
ncbi:hypothetical protein ABW19_dt0205092 [Dactylella cylindrospora]|nr:hypothetical protein ABW19_dt0205092 [Dactylella cylindrospora]